MAGQIVAGALSPHPPHLVYADNPPQNEPSAECGWEVLRWGYERLRKKWDALDYDVIIVHSPHWKTRCGHHFLGVDSFTSKSVDPVFPHLFRYHYDLKVDVELSEQIAQAASQKGLVTKMMRNPHFRVDYGTLVSCHLLRPQWDKPIVSISSNRAYYDFSNEVGDAQMLALGQATKAAVLASGKKAILIASNSLSHRHFTEEPAIPEDMQYEHVYHHGQYLWDMKVLNLMREGKCQELINIMPDFIEHSVSECKEGSLTWLLGALDMPTYPAEVYAYGSVIGTGNALVEWDPSQVGVSHER
ncbi:MAG: tRNA U-34 5-methylaminomethyl-2-thiouridine biosynthesis protein [Myxococcota bacterium]|nr:tRNA U-34 5-methylaminomethyl-2-thiouridine biosynthesis protein [Myxococcota bacterium]MEC8380250.1 tRNA U-34 5-methylaminomethyl-2-thiouridine biosynthesis protein [Myxococcota bacterium]